MKSNKTSKLLAPEDIRKHKGVSFVGVTTCFYCHDGKGNFVMAKRSVQARDENGRWDIGAGGLKWGVTAEENVRREVKEEYGADALGIDFLGYRDVFREGKEGEQTHWLALDFAVLVDPEQVYNCEPTVFDDVAWFTRDTLPMPLHSQLPTHLEKYKTQLKALEPQAF